MSDTTRLGLPLIAAGQAQKHVTHNEALRILDSLVQAVVVDRDQTAPPASPVEGATWIVAASPTGAWSGHDGHLALFADGAWTFLVPRPGWSVWVLDENRPLYWNGSAWEPLLHAIGALADLTGVGIGTAPDATNALAVEAPAALFAGVPAAHGGSGDIRLTVAKEAVADTASLLFQSDWSGRAEIGLAGDDDLRVKVSPDGSTWIDALRFVAATGQLVIGSGGMAGGGRLKSIAAFTASGTWTRPDGVRFALVFAVGGGGGGGGAAGAASSGAAGGGGGGGGLAISLLDVTAIATRTVTVGAAGAAGAAGALGGTGGASSFGSEVVAAGGTGGGGMAAGTTTLVAVGGLGGATSAGDVGFSGTPGGAALRIDLDSVLSGTGGASFFGGGGRAAVGNAASNAGTSRGSGGSGGVVANSATSRTGGAGAAGFVWVWEFE